MKKTFGILLMMLSFSAMADDVKYECSFNAKIDTIKVNVFGANPRTVSSAEFNPCQHNTTVPSLVKENGDVFLSECGVFTDEINFGLTLRAQKVGEKTARFELIHLDRKMQHQNDYQVKNVIGERIVEIGKEVVLESKTKIDFYKKSRRVKEVVSAISVLCLRAK